MSIRVIDAQPASTEACTRALSSLGLFRGLAPAALSEIASLACLRIVPRGEVLFKRGEPADDMFLVSRGRFFVFLDDDAPVAEIGVGEPIGELAFLTSEPRTATLVAWRDSEVVQLSRACYERLIDRAPQFQQELIRRLADRMRRAAPSARPLSRLPARTIGLLPIGSRPLPQPMVRELAQALGSFGATEVMDVRDLAAGGEVVLERLEQTCRFVLLPLEHPDDAVNRRLLAQCDAVMLAGYLPGGAPARPSALERTAQDLFRQRNRMLVLWRSSSGQPIADTSVWLRDRQVDLHHHVALDNPADTQRLARFIAGRALGAVLAGGGALGCGHIGMVRAFRDAGVDFDFYGGTSVGAAMGMAFATGISPEELMDRTEEIFVRKRAMRRFTLPVFGLLDPAVFDRELATKYGETDIRDLPINAYAVSTNLTRNCMHVHRTGPVWHAVRSSGSIPGALPPFASEDGDLLVDGALVDNFPIAIMRELKLGPNVLAGFFEDESRQVRIRYSALPGRGRTLADLVLRRPHRFPHFLTVLTRAMLVTSRRSLQETAIGSDLLIKLPSLARMGILDWHLGREQELAAYRHVTSLIEEAGGPLSFIGGQTACAEAA